MESRRAPYRAVLLLAAVLALPMLLDPIAALSGRWDYPRITSAGDNLVEATRAAGGRNRFLNVYLGAAVRQVAGGAPALLALPTDPAKLSNVEPDEFGGKAQPALDMRLLGPMLASAPWLPYEPDLDEGELAALVGRAETTEYPMGVVAVGAPEASAGQVALIADRSRSRIYVVPLAYAPPPGKR